MRALLKPTSLLVISREIRGTSGSNGGIVRRSWFTPVTVLLLPRLELCSGGGGVVGITPLQPLQLWAVGGLGYVDVGLCQVLDWSSF